MRGSMQLRITRIGAAVLAGAMAAAFPAFADDMGGQVTAVIGEVVTGNGRALENHTQVADDERIALGKDGAASILFDRDSLVELCRETEVVLAKDPRTGARRIRVDSGALRVVVEPRAVPEPIEIHTPTAIATIRDTIVHVAVDPASGDTTITGEENQVRVRSSDPAVPGSVTVSALEQIVVRSGGPLPARARRLESAEVERLAGCQVDFHAAASDLASQDRRLHAAERIATTDGDLDGWRMPPESPAAPSTPPRSPAAPDAF